MLMNIYQLHHCEAYRNRDFFSNLIRSNVPLNYTIIFYLFIVKEFKNSKIHTHLYQQNIN